MQLFNFNNKEIPILHFCGKSRLIYSRIFQNTSSQIVKLPDNLTIITFCDKNSLSSAPLIKQLKKCSIPFLNPAQDLKNWSNTLKPRLVLDAISEVETEYVLLLDSLDVVLTKAIAEIIERFKGYERDVLFAGCKNQFPRILIEKIQNRDALGAFGQINTGTCIGKTAAVERFFKEVVELDLEGNEYGSEQFMIRHAYEANQEYVGFDYRCECFQTFVRTTLKPMDETKQKLIVL